MSRLQQKSCGTRQKQVRGLSSLRHDITDSEIWKKIPGWGSWQDQNARALRKAKKQ